MASGDYLHTMSSRHEDMEVIEAGLSISKASSYVAASLMALSNVPAMALVCPFRFKDGTHEEMVRDTTSCLKLTL